MNEQLTTYEGQAQAPAVLPAENDALMSMDFDNVLAIAERADKMVAALNKIMAAAVRVTTSKDWVMIGGTPYLQESGASKVARLFGIGWKIHDGFPKVERDEDGFPTYTYRMTFRMGSQTIEAEGMRSAKDDFFAGKKDKRKSLDEIDLADVKRAAYTNCLNRGIKAILPGLRNLDAEALEQNGVNLSKSSGYTFKSGSKGGNSGKAEDSGIVCSACGEPVSQKVASYSQGKFGRVLCMKCQKAAPAAAPAPAPAQAAPGRGGYAQGDYVQADFEDERPPFDDRDDPYAGR